MKKLQLKALELGAREVLTRAQLKNVLGGSGSGSGTTPVTCQTSCSCSNGKSGTAKVTNCAGTCDNLTNTWAACKGDDGSTTVVTCSDVCAALTPH